MVNAVISAAALLFDLDGTLIDSTAVVNRSWRRWCAEFGVTPEAFARVHAHGRPAAELVADLVPAGVADQALARIVEIEVTDLDGVVALPGAHALLDGLPADRWAIVTSCTAPLARARLAHTGIAPPVLVTASDVTHGKPGPEPYLLGARRLGVAPEHCLVLEDAPTGLAAARAAGMRAAAVLTTHNPADLAGADLLAADLTALRAGPGPDGVALTAC